MNVGYMSLDWSPIKDERGHPTPGGAGWYRCALPAKYLAQNGTQTVYGPNLFIKQSGEFGVVDHDGVRHFDLDVVVLQRMMQSGIPEAILKARSTGQTIINDCDDHFDGLDTANAAFYTSHPKWSPERNRNIYKKALAASSAITVSTDFLRCRLERLGRPVLVVKNAIDVERWDVHHVAGAPIIGWVGATPFRSGDLETLKGILPPFMHQHPEVHFHHSGHAANATAVTEKLTFDGPISVAPMESILEYPSLFQWFNIGLVPLADKPFNEAKSHIKGLEYAVCGIPTIASPTKEYQILADHMVAVCPNNAKQWRKAFERFLDPKERTAFGLKARQVVENEFDIAKNWSAWLLQYQEAISVNR